MTIGFTAICAKADSSIQKSTRNYFNYFDTIITITVYDENKVTDQQWSDIEDIIKHIQYTFKRDAPAKGEQPSELYKLNQTAGSGNAFQCSDDLYEVIKIGMDYAELTNGRLDPAIGPLVDLWDITGNQEKVNNGEAPTIPTKDQIDQLKPLIDYNKIILDDDNKTVTLPDEGMVIDLGSIAKGFAADQLAAYFKTQGFKHGIINLGGNILVYGDRYEKNDQGTYDWTVGIRDPKTFNGDLGYVSLQDKTVVSSGTYERNFTDPATGKFYHHILDSNTGYPVENTLSSVAIITTSSTKADALSTSVFSLGLTDGMNFIEGIADTEAIFVTKDDKVHKTSGVDSKYNYIPKNEYKFNEPTKNTKYLVPTIIIGVVAVIGVGATIVMINKMSTKK
jgi:thiamine biosynthesis lipoprotein